MDPRSVEAARGVAWFGCGWQLFAKSPAMWIMFAVALFVLLLLLGSVRFGPLLLSLFAPAIGAGLLYGAAEVKAGRPLAFGHLLAAFKDQAKLVPLVILGVVLLGASALSLLVAFSFSADALRMMEQGAPPEEMVPHAPGMLIALLLMFTVQLVATALVYFAVPLVMLRRLPVGAAMQSSVRACLRNILPLFVFSLVYVVIAIVASIPFGLGWLVLLPWSATMLYCAFEDIYPDGHTDTLATYRA
jgi:hypothetical protein